MKVSQLLFWSILLKARPRPLLGRFLVYFAQLGVIINGGKDISDQNAN
jgi:hypothetical protein